MTQIKNHIKRIVLMIVIVSTILGFIAMPYSNAALNIGSNDFYYSGTTDGSYVEDKGVVDWLVEKLTQVADYILGIVTMGTRMVFVGYTALAEHALTWFLESMSGINLNGEDISSTNLTQLNDSSKNVTVQAIVYNRVPALNVNFFKLDIEDLFTDGDKIVSPTGIELKCKKCGKPVKECCTGLPESGDVNLKENHCNSDCKCNGKCSACQTYAGIVKSRANQEQTPMIFQIKKLVAIWYRLINLLSFAAMLIVLIVLGIKLAISNIVTDKALYKSMLVDWFVGMVIVASINMIMYFAISVNEIAVGIIADTADDVNKVQIMHMTETDPDKLAEYESSGVITLKDQEIEIDVYEAIRTRAYDAKLTVGTSGMIMYITLVYYAFRYTMMYLRRFLNIAILTIMGPAIGVSYAMQKVLHGKGMSFKNWLQEYILTLFIQVIHAILYGVFISQALVFSLESVSGMIFGLIMMHYTFKIDKLFRKIFNFGEGRGMKDLDSAGDLRKRGKDLKNLRNAIGAGTVGGMVLSSPAAKAMKTVGRAAGSAAVIGTAAAVSGVRNAWNSPSSETSDYDDDSDLSDSFGDDVGDDFDTSALSGMGFDDDGSESQDQIENSPLAQSLNERRTKEKKEEDRQLLVLGRSKLRRDLQIASDLLQSKPTLENRKKFEEAKRRLKRYDELTERAITTMPTVSQVVSGKFNQVFNINTYIQIQREKDGKLSYKIRSGNATTAKRHSRKAIGDLLLGTQYYDPIKGKVVKEKNAAIDGLRLSNLLNFTDDDVKEFKRNILTPMKQGLGGMAAMGFGMATLVSNPMLGMSLLASGYSKKERGFKALGVRRRDRKYNKRFVFNRFGDGAIQEICDMAIKLSKEDRDRMMVARVRRNHYRLYLTMREELDKAIANGAKIIRTGDALDGITYTAEEPEELGDYSLSVGTLKALESGGTIFIPSDMIDDTFDIDDNFDDLSELKTDLEMKRTSVSRWKRSKAGQVASFAKKRVAEAARLDKVGEGVDNLYKHALQQTKEQEKEAERDTLELKKAASIATADYALKRYLEAAEESQYEEMGYKLTHREGMPEVPDGSRRSNIERTSNPSTDFDEETKKLSQGEIAQIDQTIDSIIKEFADGKSIDVGSEKVISEIIRKIGNKLFAMRYIGQDGKPEDLFEDGYFGLKTSIKKRIINFNKIIEDAEDHLKGYSAGSSDLVMGSVQDLMDSRSDSRKRYKKLSPLDVIEKLKEEAGITSEAKPETGIPHQEQEKASFKDKVNDGTTQAKTPTTEEVGRYIVSREIVEVDQEEGRNGETNRTYSKEEVKAAKQYLEHMSKEDRAMMNRAVEAVINQPITEDDIIEAMAERVKNEDKKGRRDESTSKKNLRKLVRDAKVGEKDSSDQVKEARSQLKKVVGKEISPILDMFNGSLNVEPDHAQVKTEANKAHAKDTADMMEMIEMAFMGEGDSARQMIEDSDSSDKMKRLQLDTLLAFEREVETIEDLNEYAMRNEDRLGMENSGSKKYKELRTRINDEETEMDRMKLRVARFEREHGMFETIDYDSLSNVEKMEYERIRQLREQISAEERKIEQAKKRLKSDGPVGNVRDLVVDKKKSKSKRKK